MRRYAVACLVPLLGAVLAAFGQAGRIPNPIVYLRADQGSLILLAGILFGAVVVVVLAARDWGRRGFEEAVARAAQGQADTHRCFVRRLDHEVKNPLTAIRAALVNLNGGDHNPTLESVRGQVDRLVRLTTDLRKLTDLETLPIDQEPVDIGQLLTELLLLAREQPAASCCRLSLILPQAPWPLPPITGDRDLLFLAFHNLVDNALKFSRQGDAIEIRAFEDGLSVVAEVADTGPGVSEDDLPHLGEELYRGAGAVGVEGSGLGLALVRAIVSRHHGALEIRSRLGQGTVVSLRFPATK